jgi:hypothetical protein
MQNFQLPFWKIYITPHVIQHTLYPPCNTDQVITPLGDMTCCISNLLQWHSLMNQRLNHIVLLYKKCNCIRIMLSLNTYNKNVDIIWHYCIISHNMKQARPWILANLKIICQFHVHPVHQMTVADDGSKQRFINNENRSDRKTWIPEYIYNLFFPKKKT